MTLKQPMTRQEKILLAAKSIKRDMTKLIAEVESGDESKCMRRVMAAGSDLNWLVRVLKQGEGA